jgi:hypothetical protein
MLIIFGLLSTVLASSVFVIDDGDADMASLVTTLEGHGHAVETSAEYGFTEEEFSGFEVDLSAYDVVVWLDGGAAALTSMPDMGQAALLEFVAAGGGVMLFGQNGFNFLAGRHPDLAPLIPLRSWTMMGPADFVCEDGEHDLCAGFDLGDLISVPSGYSQAGSTYFGTTVWGVSDSAGTFTGGVTFDVGEGRGVQWAMWGDSISSYWQTPWGDATVGQLLDNAVRWAGQGPPRPDIGGPYFGVATEVINLDASGSTARGEASIALYEWTVDDFDWSTTTPTTTFDTAGIDGPFVGEVQLVVTDTDGRHAEAFTSLNLENADPVIVEISCPGRLDEGGTETFRVEFEEPEPADTVDILWFVDGIAVATGAAVDIDFEFDGVFPVHVLVADDDGGIADEACPADVVVENVRPLIVGDPASVVDAGDVYVFEPSVDDPGVTDVHSWAVSGPMLLTVDADTGRVSWAPSLEDIGAHTVSLRVFDGLEDHVVEWVITVQWPDADGDGISAETDCDDTDSAIFPGAEELCDTTDSDCDDSLVDGFSDYDGDLIPDCVDPDADGDGDGMVDGWEAEHGLDPLDGSDGSSDSDGDGRTALEEFEAGSDPSVYEGPGQPEVLMPIDGAEIGEFPAALVIYDGDAPLGQALVHGMILALDSSLETVVAEVDGLVGAGDGTTGWMIAEVLEENTWYHWTAFASDDWTTGAAMVPVKFFHNLVNEAPRSPVLGSPLDGAWTDTMELIVGVPEDPDLDMVEIIFSLTLEDGSALDSVLIAGEDGLAHWTPSIVVEEEARFCWSAIAIDEHGLASAPSDVACFNIDPVNYAPSSPSIEAPIDTVDTLSPTLVVTNGEDPEGRETWHRFQLDTQASFGSESLQEAEVPSGDDGQTSWSVPFELSEDTMMYARVLCSDGDHDSDWVTTSFFVSVSNHPPSVPVLLDPADGIPLAADAAFVVTNSIDPEADPLHYEFQILDLRDGLVAEGLDIAQGEGTTQWLAEPLDEGHYQWTARAVDDGGEMSDFAAVRSFVVGNPSAVQEPDLGGMVGDPKAEGCSCSATTSPKPLVWIFLVLLGLVQRRKSPRC